MLLDIEIWIKHKLNKCFPICRHCIEEADDMNEALRQGFENLAKEHEGDHQIRFVAKQTAALFERMES